MARRVRPRAVACRQILSALVLAAFAASASAQVGLTALDTPYAQNFDTLPTSGSAQWSNNATILGWYQARTGTGTTIVADTGASNAGNLYSYGAAGDSDRALGTIGSGGAAAGSFFYGVRLQNNTGATITSFDVSYTGEQWRNSAAAAQTATFSYLIGSPAVTGSLAEFQSAGVAVTALDLTSPITGGTAGALNGNLPANQQAHSVTISGLSIAPGTEVMLRWSDPDNTGSDHGLAIDDVQITPHGVGGGIGLSIADVSKNEGNAGTTTFTFTVSLPAPAPAGGVSFDIATADGTATAPSDYTSKSLTAQTIPEGGSTYTFDVLVNGDTATEPNETFFVNVSNVSGATLVDGQGVGTIVNDDFQALKIHDLQGNGATTPIPAGTVVSVEGVVTANFQGTNKLSGFFLQEEDADADADPNTSEGIFVYCSACPTAVAEGQRVQVSGTVTEFFGMTELNATTAPSITITDAGNHLAEVTPTPIELPVVGDVDAFYEAREGMLVTYVDTLLVSEYFEQARYGQIELYPNQRPRQFTEFQAPSVTGYTAYLDTLSRSRVILDDDNDVENWSLTLPEGQQYLYYPRANGGLSVGTQGVDFFRGGDEVHNLTGVLHWSFSGVSGTDAWRIRPVQATPATFTVANPRPTTAPAVGGAIKAAGMNLLNYFTTIDTTSSSSSGPCGPSGGQDCRGADSVAELNRQRERASIVLCTLNPDVAGLMELENTTPSATITDLLDAVNARCGGAHPYTFDSTGGTLGTDAIRVALIYRAGVLSPVGSALVDLDPIHNRPPTAQTFDVVDSANAAFGKRFTVIANHFKSKGCGGASGGDSDSGDGQSCFAARRTAQASRLLAWINSTVIPAAGDSDVLLLGDFNSYAQETPVTTLTGGGYTDLETSFLGDSAYSYLFDGQLGHLDYAFASTSLAPQITGVAPWHINADENPLFDYNDEVKDTGEAPYEEKPDGSAMLPPRVLFQPATPYRASDHDPVLVGLFPAELDTDLAVAMTTANANVIAGNTQTYTITVSNLGPNAASTVDLADTLPPDTSFVSLDHPAEWDCTTPAVGATGPDAAIACNAATLPLGTATFTLTVTFAPAIPSGASVSNTATVSSATTDTDAGNNSATAATHVLTDADMTLTLVDTPDPIAAGQSLTYTATVINHGPSDATTVSFDDTLPSGETFVSLSAPPSWSCTTPAVGSAGAVSCQINKLAAGDESILTLTVAVDATAPGGTVLTNTATVAAMTPDPLDNNSATTTTTVQPSPGTLTITPPSLDFGDVAIGAASADKTATLTNTGDASLEITAIQPVAPPFVLTGGTCPTAQPPITLAVGASCTLTYAFAPDVLGTASQALTIVVDAAVSSTLTLSGNGVAPPPQADVAVSITDDREFVQIGDTVDYVIVVTNKTGPATTTVFVFDMLPQGLLNGSWVCTPTGGATCANGVDDKLQDNATLPAGSSATYVYTATVQPDAPGDLIVNSVSATATDGVADPNPGNNTAADSPADIVVIFKDGFDDDATTQPLAGFGDADGFVSAQLSVEPTLLAGLGSQPVRIASGRLADGKSAFAIDLARFDARYAMRLVTRDAQGRDVRSEWREVDLVADALDLAWQSATPGSRDGYLVLSAGKVSLPSDASDIGQPLIALRIARRDALAWLSLPPQ
jgi:uncharacterized repeat protein (TIGR01451 family)